MTSDQLKVSEALAGDVARRKELVERLLPIIEARSGRILRRFSMGAGHTLEDLVQEVFEALFEDDAYALRSWDPSRGLSLDNFVGLIAERECYAFLRSGRRNPWRETPTELETMEESALAQSGETAFYSRELLTILLARIREELSPTGLVLFERLIVDEEPIESVCVDLKMSRDAAYAWRSRLVKKLRQLLIEIAPKSETNLAQLEMVGG